MKHEFVEYVPRQLDAGVVYVSIPYATAVHACACGCGSKVVTPLTPTDWKLIFDGETVSLDPSVGSWSLPCKSHYWIKNDRVVWAKPWTDAQIAAGRRMEKAEKDAFYDGQNKNAQEARPAETLWGKFKLWLNRRLRLVRLM